MKRLSALWTLYRERQRVFAERALQQDKGRFVWVRGVSFWAGFGLVMGTVVEFQQRSRHEPLHAGGNLAFLLGALVFCGFFGYMWANWKWKDYERIAKS